MHMKYLVIMTYSFKWQIFCYPAHIDSHRDFILPFLMYHRITYMQKQEIKGVIQLTQDLYTVYLYGIGIYYAYQTSVF